MTTTVAVVRNRVSRWVWSWQTRPVAVRIVMMIVLAVLTAIAAQIRIPIPGTPVPFTGQTFVVLMAGYLLGPWYGAGAMLLYLAAGVGGVPWFAAAPFTTGYLVGFVLAASWAGLASRLWLHNGGLLRTAAVFASAIAVIYVCGSAFLAGFMGMSLVQVLAVGVAPFIVGDALKIAGAVAAARWLRRQ